MAANYKTKNTKSLLILFLVEQTHNIESTKHTTAQLSQKVKYTMIIKEQISCSGYIVRPTVKGRDANASILLFWIRDNSPFSKKLLLINPNPEVDKLIIQLTELLNNWDNSKGLNEMLTSINDDIDSIKIFVIKIYSVNA